MSPKEAPRAEEKRVRIVNAATTLFSRYGFKRTSIDLLAAEAGVAKPTVYAYFKDKDAVFEAGVVAVCEDLIARAEAAGRGRGSIDDRLAGMLAAKFTRYWELVQRSPHAQELIDSQSRLGAETIARADKAFLRLLAAAIEESEEVDLTRAGLTATGLAHLLVRAASGAAYDATTVAAHRKNLTELVRVLMLGVRTDA
jgi:AcrR family transcriptional regulator